MFATKFLHLYGITKSRRYWRKWIIHKTKDTQMLLKQNNNIQNMLGFFKKIYSVFFTKQYQKQPSSTQYIVCVPGIIVFGTFTSMVLTYTVEVYIKSENRHRLLYDLKGQRPNLCRSRHCI